MRKQLITATVLLAWCMTSVAAPEAGYAATTTRKSTGKNQKMNEPIVSIETNKGTIVVQLFTKEAPVTAGNFLDLVKRGFYNGLTFHRYEPNFVIQGGDPEGTGTGGFVDPATGTERRIPLEVKANLKHDQAGMVAMARSSEPNSASSQFYITLAPASFLDMKYAVFGKVTQGLEVALQLRKGDQMLKVTAEEPAVK